MKDLGSLIGVFLYLSLFTVGGGLAAYPELNHQVVDIHQWFSQEDLVHLYSIGQLAPGPNMMVIASIGESVCGLLGALAVVFAFFAPTTGLAFVVGRTWRRLDGWSWKASIQRGLAPISIGLLLSGCLTLASHADTSVTAATITLVVFLVLLRTSLNPAILIISGGILGAVLL